jgi:hypothetical protein
MQLSLIDPRIHPIATKAMLDDVNLWDAICFRRDSFSEDQPWPFVEHLVDVEGRRVWAVDDDGMRYVVVGAIIFRPEEMAIADARIRTAAVEVFARLDACVAPEMA